MDGQMMTWQDEYNIGVEIIDKEHQRLFKILNKLFYFDEEEKKNQRACQEGIKYLKTHAVKHFADEEEYMASVGYPDLEQHRRIHAGFREHTLPALEQELERTGYAQEAMEHFLGVCAGWLIGHTLIEDQAVTGKKDSRWTGMLPSEETNAVKKMIIQLVYDMFQLESLVISDSYAGEKFGKGVYYRLAFCKPGDQDTLQEFMLVFEEKLLINTVGKIMGLQTGRMDSMLIHASRYTAKQFVTRVMEHLPGREGYELREENLLTYEQFQQAFQHEKPQVSLLLDTGGAGYFAYCAIAPHLHQEDTVSVPLGDGNALGEVEKYLNRRVEDARQEEEHPRRKILLVDDSATVRLGISKLLGEDYDVSEADSGASAFRSITLEQPDLVLLDYEMPVCDGRQTLEMLRSVKEFENTPVIFLTGRRDPESMIKVMPLNPAGYILKTLKPAAIKEKIDTFFAEGKA